MTPTNSNPDREIETETETVAGRPLNTVVGRFRDEILDAGRRNALEAKTLVDAIETIDELEEQLESLEDALGARLLISAGATATADADTEADALANGGTAETTDDSGAQTTITGDSDWTDALYEARALLDAADDEAAADADATAGDSDDLLTGDPANVLALDYVYDGRNGPTIDVADSQSNITVERALVVLKQIERHGTPRDPVTSNAILDEVGGWYDSALTMLTDAGLIDREPQPDGRGYQYWLTGKGTRFMQVYHNGYAALAGDA